MIIRRYWTKTELLHQCQRLRHRAITLVRRISSAFLRLSVYTLKTQKLPSKQYSLLRSSFFITTSKEFKADLDLRPTKNDVNGMPLIGKATEWVYRFCFREAVPNKKRKRCHRTASRKSHTALGSLPSVALSSV